MRSLIFLIIPILLFTSCVKEELPICPGAQLSTTLSVGDINYSNASDLGLDMVDENLPFKQYISNYYYVLKDLRDGSIITSSSLTTVSGDEKDVNFTIDNVPDGEYELMVWGNVSDNQIGESGILHGNEAEGSDLYFAVDTISIATGEPAAVSLDLERAKGMLLVIFSNLPDDITQVSMSVTNIYQNRSAANYSGTTTVNKLFNRDSGEPNQFGTFLAPSVAVTTSELNILLYSNNSDTPTHTIGPIEVVIKQNEITAVRLNYSDLLKDFEISVYINKQWVVIKKLGLT